MCPTISLLHWRWLVGQATSRLRLVAAQLSLLPPARDRHYTKHQVERHISRRKRLSERMQVDDERLAWMTVSPVAHVDQRATGVTSAGTADGPPGGQYRGGVRWQRSHYIRAV